MILAIDPGPEESQLLEWDGQRVRGNWHLPNADARSVVAGFCDNQPFGSCSICVEMIASYGMPVGREVFQTCIEIGRIVEMCAARNQGCRLMPRLEAKLHLCHSARAKDANIRQALIDRFGGKDAAIGRKASPGPLYGVSSHAWAALALAITFAETQRNGSLQPAGNGAVDLHPKIL